MIGPNVRQDIIAALREHGDTITLPVTGATYRLRLTPDDANPFDDTDCYGRLEWINGYGRQSRPDGMTGNAEKIHINGDAAWWEPPADIKRSDPSFPAYRRAVLSVAEYGHIVATLERCEGTDAYGNLIVRAVSSIGGWEPFPSDVDMAEIVGQLIDDMEGSNGQV